MSKPDWLEEPPADSRRERRKQENRERIMESAIALFEDKGCELTTLEEICERAEVSRPTFYSYYASKQELIQALGEKLWVNVARELTSQLMANQASTTEYVEAFFRLTRTQIARYNRLERELIRQSMQGSISDSHNDSNSDRNSDRNNSSMNMLNGLTALFAGVYAEGKKREEIGNRYPIDFLAEMTMAGISAIMMKWAVDEHYPVDRRLKQFTDLTLQTLSLSK